MTDLIKQLLVLSEGASAKKYPAHIQRIVNAVSNVRHSQVLDVEYEDVNDVEVTVEYEFPEHVPSTKELKAVLSPEFSKVRKEVQRGISTQAVFYFTPKSTVSEGVMAVGVLDRNPTKAANAKQKLSVLMKSPISADEAPEKIYPLFYSDDLATEIEWMQKQKFKDDDVRHVIKMFLNKHDIKL